MQESPNATKIFVVGLPPEMRDELALRQAFQKFGDIETANIPRDETGGPKPYGFVTFVSTDAYERALDAGTLMVEGKPVTIKRATPRRGEMGRSDGGPSRDRDRDRDVPGRRSGVPLWGAGADPAGYPWGGYDPMGCGAAMYGGYGYGYGYGMPGYNPYGPWGKGCMDMAYMGMPGKGMEGYMGVGDCTGGGGAGGERFDPAHAARGYVDGRCPGAYGPCGGAWGLPPESAYGAKGACDPEAGKGKGALEYPGCGDWGKGGCYGAEFLPPPGRRPGPY